MRKYKIPYTLDTSMLDAPIPLTMNSNSSGSGAKEVTLYDILICSISILILWWLLKSQMFLGNGSKIGSILFLIGYVILIWNLFKPTPIPGTRNYRRVMTYMETLIARISKEQRITTSVFGSYDSVANTVGFAEPDLKHNIHRCANGDYALFYRVIGSASNNIFDVDRETIVNQYASFLRSLNENVTYNFLTIIANQRVYTQLHALNQQKLHETNLAIIKSIDEEIEELKVMSERSYKTLHQYIIFRSNDIDELNDAEAQLLNFANGSHGAIASTFPEEMSHQIAVLKALYATTDIDETLIVEDLESGGLL